MRVYYESPTVLVTDRAVSAPGVSEHSVRIDEINQVYLTRTEARVPRSFLVRRLWPAALAVVLAVPLAADGSLVLSGLAMLAVSASLIATPGRVQRLNELWAVVDGGHHLCLFRTPDRRILGQVHRAVIRARERGEHQ